MQSRYQASKKKHKKQSTVVLFKKSEEIEYELSKREMKKAESQER
jgi:hypothetical protein